MVLNRFNISIFIQVLLIALVGLLFAFTLQREFMHMTTVGILIIWIGQILFLNFYISRIYRDVKRFMDALKMQDTTQKFSLQKGGRYFRQLYLSFEEITGNFKLVRIEKEAENQFFRETIRQSASGILAAEENGRIRLVNKAALDLLGLEGVENLEDLRRIHPALGEMLNVGKSQNHFHARVLVDGRVLQLAVKTTDIRLQGKPLRIFYLIDISSEMDRNEVEAWQKLIRILNHEITNSVMPIHILSTSLRDLFTSGQEKTTAGEIDDEVIDKTILGLETITKRSRGLAEFVDSYRSFTRPVEPEFTRLRIAETVDHIRSLMAGEIQESGIDISVEVNPANLEIRADEKLIEQTLINLVRNAIQAQSKSEHPMILIRAFHSGDRHVIEVSDKGKGIPADLIDNIFTPFFTTRKEGSGIGLSLARQVMQMHRGSIHVQSEEGQGSAFTLRF